MNTWSSSITITQGDEYLDISSAAMGKLSTTPIGAYNQPSTFPKGRSASFFRFDPELFNENSWPTLKGVLTKVGCVSGCRLTVSHSAMHTWSYRSGGAHKVQLKVVFLILKYYLGLALCIDSYVVVFFCPSC